MRSVRLVLTILFALFFVSSFLTAQEKWKLEKNAKGVKVYTRTVPGSDYREMMAVGVDDIPFEVAAEVAKDYNSYQQWYGMCKTLKLIKKSSDSNFDMYFVLDMPVVTNRDAVIRVKTNFDFKKGRGRVTMTSVDSSYKKDAGLVRMPKVKGSFTITRLGPSRVQVVYQIHADMGGNVPAWVVNTAAVKHPFDTAVGVKRQARKPVYTEQANKLHKTSYAVPR